MALAILTLVILSYHHSRDLWRFSDVSTCNRKFLISGFGGGFNDRQDVEYIDRDSSGDEIDDVRFRQFSAISTFKVRNNTIISLFISSLDEKRRNSDRMMIRLVSWSIFLRACNSYIIRVNIRLVLPTSSCRFDDRLSRWRFSPLSIKNPIFVQFVFSHSICVLLYIWNASKRSPSGLFRHCGILY